MTSAVIEDQGACRRLMLEEDIPPITRQSEAATITAALVPSKHNWSPDNAVFYIIVRDHESDRYQVTKLTDCTLNEALREYQQLSALGPIGSVRFQTIQS